MPVINPDFPTAQEIAAKCGKPTVKAGKLYCLCPAHADKEPSLCLETKGDHIVWTCRAGCPQDAVTAALRANGAIPVPKPHLVTQRASTGSLGRLVVFYPYEDENEVVQFEVCRFEPKAFRQRRPQPDGKYLWGLGGVRPYLYRLPQVIREPSVFVCEGEKDADTLSTIGVLGTCNPMGAGKWRDSYSAVLKGKEVVVLPDNDEPGRAHALAVAASVRKAGAASVKIVDLWTPADPKGADVTDWVVTQGGHARRLRQLVDQTPEFALSPEQPAADWLRGLIEDERGVPRPNEHNAIVALTRHPLLTGRVRLDTFALRIEVRDLPGKGGHKGWRPLREGDPVALAAFLQAEGIDLRPGTVAGVLQSVAEENPFHPVRDYFQGLRWDGTPRLDTMLVTYCGAPVKSPDHARYLAAAGSTWMIGTVARVMQPGCQMDTTLVLEGPQYAGKSSFGRILASEPWFADQIADMHSKDASADLQGKLIVEHAELGQMRRGDVDTIKAFLTRRVDHYRPSYARLTIDAPRQCTFMASTNEASYLRDTTGNRRFQPFLCGVIDLVALERDRDQLWAEAFSRYSAGEPWHMTGELYDLAQAEAEKRVTVDPWLDKVHAFVLNLYETTPSDVLQHALEKPTGQWTEVDQKRVGSILRSLGFYPTTVRVGRFFIRRWVRKPA